MPAMRLLLVDGTALLYRAFYAIPSLKTKSGQPTNSIFGFVRMFRQLLSIWKPSHVVVAFDGGRSAVRMLLQEDYKANRKPMPDELRVQIPWVEDYLKILRVCRVRLEKEEADDVLATLADRASSVAQAVWIATSDKDIFQLVTDRVLVVPLAGKEMGGVAMKPADVMAKTGVGPNQIVDWLSLTGDVSDNIPGVPGIGAKTASKLLSEYGSVDQLLQNVEALSSKKIRDALKTHQDLVRKNRKMVELTRDLDLSLDWKDTELRSPEVDKLIVFFETVEFHAMAKELREPSFFSDTEGA